MPFVTFVFKDFFAVASDLAIVCRMRAFVMLALMLIVAFLGIVMPVLIDAHHWWPRKPK